MSGLIDHIVRREPFATICGIPAALALLLSDLEVTLPNSLIVFAALAAMVLADELWQRRSPTT